DLRHARARRTRAGRELRARLRHPAGRRRRRAVRRVRGASHDRREPGGARGGARRTRPRTQRRRGPARPCPPPNGPGGPRRARCRRRPAHAHRDLNLAGACSAALPAHSCRRPWSIYSHDQDDAGGLMQTLMVDFIISLDGYSAAEGWPGFWGMEGPEYLGWLDEQPQDAETLMGATTYREMSQMAAQAKEADSPFRDEEEASLGTLDAMAKVVFSSTLAEPLGWPNTDRKSTRLNSSHVKISYAVFCLKKQ